MPSSTAAINLSVNDVKVYFTNWLTAQGNPHLKLGNVTEKNADTITAEIVTQDGSLTERFDVDRHNGTLKAGLRRAAQLRGQERVISCPMSHKAHCTKPLAR